MKVVQHLFGDVEVGDDAVLQRPDGHDVAGVRPSIAFASWPTASTGVVGLVDGDDGRLVEHDPLATNVDQRVRRSEVHREVVREHPANRL